MITTTHNRQTTTFKRRTATIPERRRPGARDDADGAQSAGRADLVGGEQRESVLSLSSRRPRRVIPQELRPASERGGVPHKVRHITIN